MPRKLDIGAARTKPVAPDFETLDLVDGQDHQARWGTDPLPFPDNAFDEIYSSHTLEHVPWFQTQAALGEVLRILKRGALFEVWVPDFGYIIECYGKNVCGDRWRKHNPGNDAMIWVNGRIFTYGPNEENWHRAVFDKLSLRDHLLKAGFARVKRIPKRRRGTSHGPLDLGFSARKP